VEVDGLQRRRGGELHGRRLGVQKPGGKDATEALVRRVRDSTMAGAAERSWTTRHLE
jgi:hypothetical protein